jgi:branched-chain amino acid transport system permease protein
MTSQLLFGIFNGLVLGAAVFMVAAGLTLVFGILKIFNFAHGSFFMLGAYIAHAILGQQPSSLALFLLAALVASGAVGLLGVVTDSVVFRGSRACQPSTR